MNILFVCSFGRDRSATGAKLYRVLPEFVTDHAGVHPHAHRPLQEAQVTWADLIVTFTRDHLTHLCLQCPAAMIGKEVVCLNIQNRYAKGAKELEDRILTEMQRCRPDLPSPRQMRHGGASVR